jgi:hypothetical protein
LHLLFKSLPGVRSEALPLPEVLDREARALVAALRAGSRGARHVLESTQQAAPTWQQGRSDVASVAPKLEDARRAVARWHGFAEWADVARSSVNVDPLFEAAADAIVEGDAVELLALLEHSPALARARSPYPHRATLLHHVAANGIENNRQWQSPRNAVEIAKLLLAAGAEPDATCDSYGRGGNTTLELLVTSSHPAVAGVQADLVEALCNAGAKPDGLADDGLPLWAAVKSGYADAAERLAHCGARVDNVLLAAAVGDMPRLRGSFDAEGRLLPEPTRGTERLGPGGPAAAPEHLLEYALIYAAGHGRRAAVELLLELGPDLEVREPVWNDTAFDKATYQGRRDIIGLLEAARARG